MDIPQTKKEVRTFLGLTRYYRQFIPSIAAPLTDITRNLLPNQVVWTKECGRAFGRLKELLCSSPVLYNPDFDKPFLLQTDASDCGMGAVLSQRDDDGQDYPVAYHSRKFLPREERYSTIEKE